MDAAVRDWAGQVIGERPDVLRIGYFGSYARGNWGVGSDVDIVVLLRESDEPFHARGAAFDTTALPVPADLLVYTVEEWSALIAQPGFAQSADRDTVWVVARLA